jgi:TIR domain-containing protein
VEISEKLAMNVFVCFGYNDRDHWIEETVFPVLQCMGFTVVDGKDMPGQVLQPEIKSRIDQSDAVIGFFTIRKGQRGADFNSHIWVQDEMVYAHAKGKMLVPIREEGARIPKGLLGDRQYIVLSQKDRLKCVVELVQALGNRNIRRIRLEPETDRLSRDLHKWLRNQAFSIRYRSQSGEGVKSAWQEGRLEVIDQGFYMNVSDVPKRAYLEVEGRLGGDITFSSGLASADAVMVKIN